MVSVRINGQDAPVRTEGVARIADLVELIKAVIDPDHMITSLLLDGRDLEETDWAANPEQYGTAIVEVETDTPASFVSQRFARSSDIVEACFFEFRASRKHFQVGESVEGNKKLGQAVNALQAFFEWYGSLLDLVPQEEKKRYEINEEVTALSEVCKTICQQQLYQSWWALGESIENQLEPLLDKLESKCRQFGSKMAA
ncbi:MAG: hypothetical protein KDD55_11930 [Bdellovibrionales bacterium]|nr:hypothetical protein [Bdellovibrionales bacterium]